jgi:hypothetical protein
VFVDFEKIHSNWFDDIGAKCLAIDWFAKDNFLGHIPMKVYKSIIDMNQRGYMIVDESMISKGIAERLIMIIIKRNHQ